VSGAATSSEGRALRVYLVDDEPLAVKRLTRLLEATSRVTIVGSCSDPERALSFLQAHDVDLLFLDIEMPVLTGFDLLARLERQPLIVFTTAYDRYALRAFEVNSIDYLLKPIEPEQLERALNKLERIRAGARQAWAQRPDVLTALEELSRRLLPGRQPYPRRVASRLGDRVQLLDVDEITHFLARDKLTYAIVAGRTFCVDYSIVDLERRLDPGRFLRIHRSIMVNLDWVLEVDAGRDGGPTLRLKDGKATELQVARDRARLLKDKLGI
jgi:two-component system LytT family response regulator